MFKDLPSFYTSRDWRNFRKNLIAERTNKEDGLLRCERCGEPILNEWECVAHHKQPLTAQNMNDLSISLNPDNILLLHHKCHNMEHKRFGHSSNDRKVYLITGSPFAGKKTFVRENKGNSDIVLDLDSLWSAITMSNELKPKALNSNLFGLRETLLDQIKTRLGRWEKAWVIMSLPRSTDRDRYIDLLGAEEINIGTTKDICVERLYLENNIDHATYQRYIEDYWTEKNKEI